MNQVRAEKLLAMWERGDGERVTRKALALLATADPGASENELADLPIGSRDAALLDLRERLFGAHFTGRTSCPACAEQIELTFEADELRRTAARDAAFSMRIGEYDVALRLPSTIDLEAIEESRDIASARAALFSRCVTSVDRDGQTASADHLPADAIDVVAARMSELDPQADVAFDVDCPTCAYAWREPFDVVTFLWHELDAAARHLLADVHRLALAYGWSESVILALSSARRAAYLGMLE
ncbi:MAG: phage baseplate protein [Thermoanaerobaculia bacterium]